MRVMGALTLLLFSSLNLAASESPSGAEIASLCEQADPNSRARCEKFFREGLRRNQRSVRACPPKALEPAIAAKLFVDESKRYPQVLHVSALKLLDGMLIKFFPCPGQISQFQPPVASVTFYQSRACS